MHTPIYDFVSKYMDSDAVRLHMPGHKGQPLLGCEARDITEIAGADALYEASGIIEESEANATTLFGTAKTVYSTEGSTQCIKAMLELVRRWWLELQRKSKLAKCNYTDSIEVDVEMIKAVGEREKRPLVLAARNVHKAFIYAAILLDFEVVWLWPEEEDASLCECKVTAETLERVLEEKCGSVAAVYLTSPNYLGGLANIPALARICHEHNVLLCVDNAHGAYLHFLENSLHPMDFSADLCCDSAHKTLPVLTGGAYLHIGKKAPEELCGWAKDAMELFGSTSPSYLILQSLDLCNACLAKNFRESLALTCYKTEQTRAVLRQQGWRVEETDPLRITIKAPEGLTGQELAEQLRQNQIECEYADADYLVAMVTAWNREEDFERLIEVLGENKRSYGMAENKRIPPVVRAEAVWSMRQAYFASGEVLKVEQAKNCICRKPTATCPPAIPVVVPGERIDEAAIQRFLYYGIDRVEVVQEA